jgi:hypothetical protein
LFIIGNVTVVGQVITFAMIFFMYLKIFLFNPYKFHLLGSHAFDPFLGYVVAFFGSYENYCIKVITTTINIIIIITLTNNITLILENLSSLIMLAVAILDINIGHKILQ